MTSKTELTAIINALETAHLSQIAEAMPLEIDYAVALQESQANNQQNDDASAAKTASPSPAEVYQDNAGRAHLAVLDKSSGECVYYRVDAEQSLICDAIVSLSKGGNPVSEQWDGGEDDPAAAYQWICDTVESHNGGAWESDPLNLFKCPAQ